METDHHSPIKWCFACYICCRRFWPHLHWRRFSVSRNDSFVSGFSSAMAAARNINQPWLFVLGCFNQCNGVRFENATCHLFLNKKAKSSHSLFLMEPMFDFYLSLILNVWYSLTPVCRLEGCDCDVWRYLLNTWCWCWCWSSCCFWCWSRDFQTEVCLIWLN